MKNWHLALCTWCCFSCHNQVERHNENEKPLAAKDIFPLTSYISGQLHLVDSIQPAIVKFTTLNNKTDTVVITPKELEMLAIDFLKPDLSNPSFNNRYQESSFADQSIPSVSLNYTAIDNDLEIRRMDVIIKPDPVYNDKVQSIYVEKIINQKDKSINKKLFWKTNKYFQVISNTIPLGGSPQIEQTKVIWDPTD